MTVGIIGGGALGLSAALRLVQAGREVVLLDRDTTLGGLAAGFKLGPSYLERFYHHLFQTDRTIVRLIHELGLGERLLWGSPDTSVLYEGRIHSLDSPQDVLRFSPISLPDRLRLGAVLAYLKFQKDASRFEGKTAAEWLQRWMGRSAYQVVWEPQLRAKFGDRYQRIGMPWFWARVHYRTPSLGYLRGGFHLLYERLGEVITSAGGRIELGQEVNSISSANGGVRVETPQREYQFERLLVTLPTRLFLRLAQGLPPEYVDRFGSQGEHLAAQCLILALERQLLPGVYWLSVNDPSFPFMAAVEHTNFLPPEDYGGCRVVYLGNYLPLEHEYMKMDKAAILDLFTPHLRTLNPAFEPAWIRESHLFKAPFAQPLVTPGYPATLPPHETPLPGVLLANMGHVYPQDRGQNYSVALGERMARMLL